MCLEDVSFGMNYINRIFYKPSHSAMYKRYLLSLKNPNMTDQTATTKEELHSPDGSTTLIQNPKASEANPTPDVSDFKARKSHKSSIVLIPPEDCWKQIQEIRKLYDKGYERWMPHINMLYPFLADANDGQVFTQAVSDLTPVLHAIKPFTIKFTKDSFKFFRHKKFCTLWLKPIVVDNTRDNPGACSAESTSSGLEDLGTSHPDVVQLQGKLVDTFPECTDVNRISDRGFTPHLSVGQFKPKEVAKYAEEFQKEWSDIEFEVKEVCLISRADFHDPFHIRHRVQLGD